MRKGAKATTIIKDKRTHMYGNETFDIATKYAITFLEHKRNKQRRRTESLVQQPERRLKRSQLPKNAKEAKLKVKLHFIHNVTTSIWLSHNVCLIALRAAEAGSKH